MEAYQAIRDALQASGEPDGIIARYGEEEIILARAVLPGEGGETWRRFVLRMVASLEEIDQPGLKVFPLVGAGESSVFVADVFDGPSVQLRADQVMAAQDWRIGFLPGDSSAQGVLRWTAHQRLKALGTASRDCARLLTKRPTYRLDWLPGLIAEPFERLMRDILNEETNLARHASLHEDFAEKTDLRVHYKDLGRPRGARVQISRSVTEFHHENKASGIKGRDEFVILSPWTLSAAKQDAEEQARALLGTFSRAIRRAHHHPRGAMQFVPVEIRDQVREYVHAEAFRSTQELRAREETKKSVP